MRNDNLLISWFDAALAAVDPDRAVRAALGEAELTQAPVHLLAIGKAAVPMADAAIAELGVRGLVPASVLAVAAGRDSGRGYRILAGDHPLPGSGSLAAADAIGNFLPQVASSDECWVLLSGGTSSLAAAPVRGVAPDALAELFRILMESGLAIGRMNAVRKRFLRWGAGRIAQACGAQHIRVLAISDVPGDSPADIGSGPCAPDPLTAGDVWEILSAGPLLHRLPHDITSWLRAALAGSVPETPKPDEPAFRRVSTAIVARNADAVDGALRAARDAGWSARPGPPLAGEAWETGTAIGRLLRESESACVVSGGECVVRTDTTVGTGGRCMELALAAARELAGLSGVTLLAAGTDGRDGPTDAAGAIVDGGTWKRMVDAGVDPDRALAEHDSYRALDAAGSLLRTGPTRTNVMDLVIAIRS